MYANQEWHVVVMYLTYATYEYEKFTFSDRRMTPLITCFPFNCKSLSLIPRTHIKESQTRWCVLVFPALKGPERQAEPQNSIAGQLIPRPMKDLFSETKTKTEQRQYLSNNTQGPSLAFTCTPLHTILHT